MIRFKFNYVKITLKKVRAGIEDRTRSVPAWKAGAPPLMRYLLK